MLQKVVNIIYSRTSRYSKPLDPEQVGLIKAAGPGIKFWDITELVRAEEQGDQSSADKLKAILAMAEVMYGFPPPPNLIPRSPGLKWIQTPLAGIDPFLIPEIIDGPVILTNARGIHDQVAELAMNLMLMLAKKAPAFYRLQRERRWQSSIPGLLHSRTVGILGLGNIGREIARLAKAFHMKVIGMKVRPVKKLKNVDAILPPEQLSLLLRQSDYVVVTLPLTSDTTRLIGETELKAMKPSAYLINVARGGIVDEQLLVRALKENWIAGAGLDVFTLEPLPPGSPLWDLPNVIITPHCGGLREDYDLYATRLFCKNLKRYLSGKELLNIIDKKKGY